MCGVNRFVALTLIALVAASGYAIATPDGHQLVADCSGVANCSGYVAVDCSAPEVAAADCSGNVSHHHSSHRMTGRQLRKAEGDWYLGKWFFSPARAIHNARHHHHQE